MRNNNGRISGKTIAIFLVVLSLVNIGILLALRQNGTTTSKQNQDATDAMELYESESVVTPEPTEDTTSTEQGVTAEAPDVAEDFDDEDAEPEETAPSATATAKPAETAKQSGNGPTLLYDEDSAPTVTQEDLDHLAELYVKAGALQAMDANGNDISDDIKGIYSADPSQRLRFYATFIVEDDTSERAKVDTSFILKATGPVIVLTKYSDTLAVGSDFDPDSYVLLATDEDSNDLTGSVTHIGKVNTSKAGHYVVQYRCASGGKTFVTNLAVTVK